MAGEARVPVFSVDVHPDGRRFATGAQGIDPACMLVYLLVCDMCDGHADARIRVWAMEAVKADESTGPKLLCTMTNHASSVNSVRWSPSGEYLVSGSDDGVILVWIMTPGNPRFPFRLRCFALFCFACWVG